MKNYAFYKKSGEPWLTWEYEAITGHLEEGLPSKQAIEEAKSYGHAMEVAVDRKYVYYVKGDGYYYWHNQDVSSCDEVFAFEDYFNQSPILPLEV